MITSLTLRTTALAVAAVAVTAAACTSRPATQFTLGVVSQIRVPDDIQTVRITASTGGTRGFCATYPVVMGRARLPQSLALAPESNSSTDAPVTITVVGFRRSQEDLLNQADITGADDCIIPTISTASDPDKNKGQLLRRSTQPYVQDENLYVPMPLRYSCYGVDCPGDESCRGGTCVPSQTDVTRLPPYADDLIFGAGNTCFDESACLGDAVGPTVVDAQNCVYDVPDGASLGTAGMNVRVIYEGYRAEVLDEDHDEGFFLPDPQGHPNRFQLADGLCHGDAQGKAPRVVSVAASRTCPPKNVYQPLCAHDQNTVALRPARAALYLLVDRGATMAAYLGPQNSGKAKLVQLLDVALADPVFAATVAGFRFLPTGTTLGDSCGATTYATPALVPGVPASKQLGSFAELGVLKDPLVALFDTASTLPSGAPLALDAALDPAGVFAAQFPTTIDGSSVSYEKRVVVVATNRSLTDPGIECGSGNAALAVKAAASTTDTFVLSLEDPNEVSPLARQAAADQFAQDAALPADHLIHAEDPQTSDQNVLQGVGTIIADLASCAYEKPGSLADPSKASMTLHIPPVPVPGGAPVAVPIPLDTTCGIANSSANGWNVVGGVVRVCGGSCQTIRQAIEANGGVTVSRFGSGEDALAGQVLVDMTIAP